MKWLEFFERIKSKQGVSYLQIIHSLITDNVEKDRDDIYQILNEKITDEIKEFLYSCCDGDQEAVKIYFYYIIDAWKKQKVGYEEWRRVNIDYYKYLKPKRVVE